MTEVFAGILILTMVLVLYYFATSFSEAMEHLSSLKDKYKSMEPETKWAHMKKKDVGSKETVAGTKKDVVSVWSFALGLASMPFAFIGIIPLVAIALGIWGINRTKEEGTGRWMAITGLVLGILFLISNAYMNGHFG